MAVPPRPIQIPRPRFDDALSDAIAAGNCPRVRELFDQAFWDGYKISLTWEHLKPAAEREDKPMLKLLATWGAAVTDEDMARLRVFSKDKYPGYIALLRQAGVPLSPAAMAEHSCIDMTPIKDCDLPKLIPQEWKRVQKALGWDLNIREAFIVGGALCDLFNDRAVKGVDIFINSVLRQDSVKENRRLLRAAFKDAGLEVTEQLVSSYPDTAAPEAFPWPKDGKLPFREGDYRHGITQIWTVIAGPQQTRYNIIFADRGDIQSSERFIRRMLNDLDFGLDQIAYDGKQVITTPAYDADVKERKITLKNLSDASRERLQRIVKKYPDWKLCPESKKLLKTPPSSHWYADMHGDFG